VRISIANNTATKKRRRGSWGKIYRLIKRIPRGSVTTYGAIARRLKVRGGARVVGYAMAACPSGRGIPWHRVVGAGGRLIIREPYAAKQRFLLENEGVVLQGARLDMAKYAWKAAEKPSDRKASKQSHRRDSAQRSVM
jgi:methylated-DNA-protein-cysteine methyltransferase related protein